MRFIRFALLIISFITSCLIRTDAQLLYRVTGGNLTESSYLFGTHHLAPLSVMDSLPELSRAFANAKGVVCEIDMTGASSEVSVKMMPYMLAPKDSTLSKLLTTEEMERYSSLFSDFSGGLPLQTFDMFKPMFVASQFATMIVMRNMKGYNPAEQIDTYFQMQAMDNDKELTALETVEQQSEILFCTTSIAHQLKNLKDMFDDTEKVVEQARELNDAYMSMDIERLYKAGLEEDGDTPEDIYFMTQLLDRRNAAWLQKLPELMSTGGRLVVIGALHLPGENGIIAGLRRLGYTVEACDVI
jgi:hypothetical protein